MASYEFAIADVLPGKLNALVKNLMSQMDIEDPVEAVRRINSGEWTVVQAQRRWREEDGVIYFSVTSDGMFGQAWITWLEKNGFRLSDYAKSMLRSSDFQPTNGVIYEIAVLKGLLFEDKDRIIQKIRAEAERRKFAKPNAEVACLIRKNFSDEEIEAMGLWRIVTVHEPIKDSGGGPSLLCAFRSGGGRWLSAYCVGPGGRWCREGGFAFLVSQVSSEASNY